MTTQESKTVTPYMRPQDYGKWMLIDQLIDQNRHAMAKKLLQGGKKTTVTIYPPNKKQAEAFINKVINAAKQVPQESSTQFISMQLSAQALINSIQVLSSNIGARNPGWLEAYSKFLSSFARFTKLHFLQYLAH